jgi:putative oxidoreductase
MVAARPALGPDHRPPGHGDYRVMNLALLVLRLVVGLGFAAHGAQKLFGAFGGGGIAGTGAFFEQVGLRPGRVHALAAGVAELAGGLLIAVGLLTPVAAAALIGVLTAAVVTVHARNGFFVTNNGCEYILTLAAALFALAGVGAGHWSLDHALGLDLMSTGWALAALVVGVLGGVGAVVSGRLAGQRAAEHDQPQAA